MKKTILLVLFTLSAFISFSQKKDKEISVIPEPVSLVSGNGYFKMPETIFLSIPNLPELKQTTETALGKLTITGKKVAVNHAADAAIRCVLNKTEDKTLGPEGY